MLRRFRLFVTPWTVAHQAPLSMDFSRQEYWSGLPYPPPGDLPNPGIEPGSPALQADSLPSEAPGTPRVRRGLTKLQRCYFDGMFCLFCQILGYWDALRRGAGIKV